MTSKADAVLSMGPDTWRDPESPYYDPLRVKAEPLKNDPLAKLDPSAEAQFHAEAFAAYSNAVYKNKAMAFQFHANALSHQARLPHGIRIEHNDRDRSIVVSDSVTSSVIEVRGTNREDLDNAIKKLLAARQEQSGESND